MEELIERLNKIPDATSTDINFLFKYIPPDSYKKK